MVKKRIAYMVTRGHDVITTIFPKADRDDLIRRYRKIWSEAGGYEIRRIETAMPQAAKHSEGSRYGGVAKEARLINNHI